MVFGFVFCSWISAEEDHKTSKEVDEEWLNFYSKHGEKNPAYGLRNECCVSSCVWTPWNCRVLPSSERVREYSVFHTSIRKGYGVLWAPYISAQMKRKIVTNEFGIPAGKDSWKQKLVKFKLRIRQPFLGLKGIRKWNIFGSLLGNALKPRCAISCRRQICFS